jgi:hypothetical protein
VQQVEELIRADKRITIDNVANALGCSHGLAYSIMHDRLKFWKVHVVGAQRTEGLRKNEPNGSVLATSLTVCRLRKGMLNRIVTGDESRCITTNPNQSVLQCNGNIPVHLQPKYSKFKVTSLARKVFLAVF